MVIGTGAAMKCWRRREPATTSLAWLACKAKRPGRPIQRKGRRGTQSQSAGRGLASKNKPSMVRRGTQIAPVHSKHRRPKKGTKQGFSLSNGMVQHNRKTRATPWGTKPRTCLTCRERVPFTRGCCLTCYKRHYNGRGQREGDLGGFGSPRVGGGATAAKAGIWPTKPPAYRVDARGSRRCDFLPYRYFSEPLPPERDRARKRSDGPGSKAPEQLRSAGGEESQPHKPSTAGAEGKSPRRKSPAGRVAGQASLTL
jgi:hypothetical protein